MDTLQQDIPVYSIRNSDDMEYNTFHCIPNDIDLPQSVSYVQLPEKPNIAIGLDNNMKPVRTSPDLCLYVAALGKVQYVFKLDKSEFLNSLNLKLNQTDDMYNSDPYVHEITNAAVSFDTFEGELPAMKITYKVKEYTSEGRREKENEYEFLYSLATIHELYPKVVKAAKGS